MNYFSKAKELLLNCKDEKMLNEAQNYMYLHGFLTEMSANERKSIVEGIEDIRKSIEMMNENNANNVQKIKSLQQDLMTVCNYVNKTLNADGIFGKNTLEVMSAVIDKVEELKGQNLIRESIINEWVWSTFPWHKKINRVSPEEWGPWADTYPRDASYIFKSWLDEWDGQNVEQIKKIASCAQHIPQGKTRNYICKMYNDFMKGKGFGGNGNGGRHEENDSNTVVANDYIKQLEQKLVGLGKNIQVDGIFDSELEKYCYDYIFALKRYIQGQNNNNDTTPEDTKPELETNPEVHPEPVLPEPIVPDTTPMGNPDDITTNRGRRVYNSMIDVQNQDKHFHQGDIWRLDRNDWDVKWEVELPQLDGRMKTKRLQIQKAAARLKAGAGTRRDVKLVTDAGGKCTPIITKREKGGDNYHDKKKAFRQGQRQIKQADRQARKEDNQARRERLKAEKEGALNESLVRFKHLVDYDVYDK